jgi:predicted nucleotide-binding protein (sugar kinase/HSP70/actin superfamily)
MATIGIPRALAYYQYYPMWRTFFTMLGADVVVSQPTTQKMLADGATRVVADTCLPAKVYLGHVISLVDKCDYMFIPVIRSVKRRVYNCAKFLGLPDMTRAVIPECPPILDIDFDINKGAEAVYKSIYEIAKPFSKNKGDIKQAALSAWEAHTKYHQLMVKERLTPLQALSLMYEKNSFELPQDSRATIGLIGHHYLLYDELVNHRLVERLKKANCRIMTPEMAEPEQLEAATKRLAERAYWTWEEEVIGAGGYYLENKVDGVIGVAAFGCGPDSLMMDTVHREATKLRGTPFMNLTLEEHTAEAGVVTRLEAFLDMIFRKRRRLTCA